MANKDRLDFDDILRAVAGKTKQDTEIDDLGRALQISPHDIESAKVANRHGVSHMGSLNLLRDWAKRQKSSTMKQNLKDALEKLQWFEILGECYPEVGADTVTVPTKRNPSLTSGLPMDTTDDSSKQYGAAGQSHPSPSPGDSSGQHGAAGPSHPPTPHDKWKNHTVTPAKSGPDESDREMGMEEAVQAFTKQLEKDKPQSAVVYISSHGNEEGIEGFDRNKLPIPDLLKMFSGVLLGKPKVLIIDACWGDDETRRSSVSESSSSSGALTKTFLPENADIFMIHSTSYGKMTWSFTTYGSWIVDELCKVVYDNDRDLEDLDTIMLRVTKGVRTIRGHDKDGKDIGTQSTTVLKQGVDRKLFFYPGFPPTNV